MQWPVGILHFKINSSPWPLLQSLECLLAEVKHETSAQLLPKAGFVWLVETRLCKMGGSSFIFIFFGGGGGEGVWVLFLKSCLCLVEVNVLL